MLFALVILNIYTGWLDSLCRGLSDGAEGGSSEAEHRSDGRRTPPGGDWFESSSPSASSLSPLPDIPEMYLRPELIPIKQPDDTPKIADRFVRSRH